MSHHGDRIWRNGGVLVAWRLISCFSRNLRVVPVVWLADI